MPRNAQGLYVLPAGNPVVSGTIIESVWANDTMSDIADAMTGSLPRDGSAPMTGPLTLNGAVPSSAHHAVSKAYVDQFMAYSSGMPIGAVSAFGGSVAPAGWLLCNGAAVSRTTYADLFALVGTTYGAGDSSTTFNLPDLRSEFIRGRPDGRAIGNKQAASFASHTHVVSDPGHTHTQAAHAHSVSTVAHSHGVSDPGHAHSIPVGATQGGWEANSGTGFRPVAPTNTGTAGTGISIQSASPAGTAAAVTPVINSATTGETVGAAGGTETVPQNMALDYYIKALHDAAGVTSITSINTSDAQMISVDATNVAVPVLDIHSNVAFGTVKLDASGKVPLNQMPTTSQQFLGYFDASPGTLPVGTFSSGDYYAVSVQGTLTVYDPVTLTASPTLVPVGSQLHYVSGSVSNPNGWYTLTVSGATLASDVQFIPVGGIAATNVQTALAELDSETQTALAGKAPSAAATGAGTSFPPSGSIGASNVTAAIQELDTETVKIAGGTMTGDLIGIDFTAPLIGIGTSSTLANNFALDASADNGTMKLARESGQDIMTVDAAGKVAFPAGSNELGVGQTWQDVTAGKTSGGTLVNNTGKPIMGSIRSVSGSGASGAAQIDVAGLVVQRNFTPTITGGQSITVATAIIPAGASYAYVWTGTPTIMELR